MPITLFTLIIMCAHATGDKGRQPTSRVAQLVVRGAYHHLHRCWIAQFPVLPMGMTVWACECWACECWACIVGRVNVGCVIVREGLAV